MCVLVCVSMWRVCVHMMCVCVCVRQEATGGQGVDVIVEMLANVNLSTDLQMLVYGGRVTVRLLTPNPLQHTGMATGGTRSSGTGGMCSSGTGEMCSNKL